MRISVEGIRKKYNDRSVIKDVNLNLYKGEITFIIGKSGAGKTTLLNLIGGIEKLDSGEINFEDDCGNPVLVDEDKYRAKKVAFIFQDYNLIEGMSILENLRVSLCLADIEFNIDEIKKLANHFDIKDIKQKVETLSGGEKQRVAIIRALLKDAKIILADEPTGNLDNENSVNIFNSLSSIKEDKIIVIVTHDLEYAEKYGDRIIRLDDGKVIEDRNIEKKSSKNSLSSEHKKGSRFSERIMMLLLLTKNSIKRRLLRVMTILTVIALTISFLTGAINLQFGSREINDTLNSSYLETDLVEFFYDKDSIYSGSAERPISNELKEFLLNHDGIKEYVEIYNFTNNLYLSNGSILERTTFKQVENNDFFEERIMNNEVEGNFINELDEIIIGKDIKEKFFEDGNAINETIFLSDGDGNSFGMKIVGINNTMNPSGNYLSYISNNAVKELATKYYSKVPSAIEMYESTGNSTEISSNFSIKGELSFIDGNEVMTFGEIADNINDTIISSKLYNLLKEDDKNHIFDSQEMYIKHAIAKNVNVVGVFESDEIQIRVSNDFFNEIAAVKSKLGNIYVKNPKQDTKIINELKEVDSNLIATSTYENFKNNISSSTETILYALFFVSIVFFVTAVLMIHSFSKIMVSERTYEIAILKSLGMKKAQVFLVLSLDLTLVLTASTGLAGIINILFVDYISNLFEEFQYLNISYPFGYFILISLSLYIVCLFTVLLHNIGLIKNTISNLLRKKI